MKPIRTEDDYQDAMGELGMLWGAEGGSEAHGRLEVLGMLVDVYEKSLMKPQAKLDPVEVIKAEMDMNGRSRADLAGLIGANRASEVMAKRRALTLPMIRALVEAWNIPADLLIADYPTQAAGRVSRYYGQTSGRARGRTDRKPPKVA